ncbi:MAG: hypothetical protein IPL61_34335 [Myxococcales bacterium]|nr:hypothetical protein [Myxococcales bacterium]
MTELVIPVRAPFDFAQTRARIAGFPPCQGAFVLDDDAVLGAYAVGDHAIAWRLGPGPTPSALRLELPGTPPVAVAAEVARLVAALVSADDDLGEFYARAADDHPALRAIVARHHGLHHVRFPSLAEVTCYAVLAQRTPMTVASALRRRIVTAYGQVARFATHALPAFPTLATLRGVSELELAALLRHPEKARRLHEAVAAVDELGEDFLRAAPYAQAADALRAVRGLGPFSVAMILLRGLGRTDHMDPRGEPFASIGRAIYGAAWDPSAIERRYGRTIGTWAYYLRIGAPPMARTIRAPRPPRGAGALAPA